MWRRRGQKRQPSGIRISGAGDPLSASHGVDDPMDSFRPVTTDASDGAVLQDEVPDIIANKIQKHHELWYLLAYGRPRDRRVSGGYALQPARIGGQPLPRPNAENSEVSGLTHIASWKSRPRLWSDIGSPVACAAGGHRPITSIDYGNADEVVLSNTQEADEDMLNADDTLPAGSPKFLIHPYDRRKVVWDIFVAILIVYGCLNIPLRIGFDLPTSLGQIIADSFIDIVFLSDIILSFRTVYLAPDGEPVTSPGDIALRYLKGAFLIDLSKIGGKEDDLKNVLNPSLWALIKMFVSLIFIAHIMGCMWNWLLILSPDEQTWAAAYGVADTTWGHRYLVGVYWAFTTMTTVGYGDITSASDLERCFSIVGMIIGATVFGYIIGNVAAIMESFNVTDAIENGKMNQIKEWLYDRKFPPALADKIRRQYRYIFTEVGVFDNSEIVDVMPGVISTSLLYAQHRAVAKGVGFLRQRPPVLVGRLLRKMVPCFANCGDVLYLEHEVGGHWYFLRAGTVSFYVSVSPLETQSEVLLMRSLSDDGHFGLTPVLLNVLNSETATVTAAAELLTIRKDDLIDILQHWPEVMAELTIEAERLFKEVKKFRARKQSAGVKLQAFSSRTENTLNGSLAESARNNSSDSPDTDITHPSAPAGAASGAAAEGRDGSSEMIETQAGGDERDSNDSGGDDGDGGGGSGGCGMLFRGDESKQAEAVGDVSAVDSSSGESEREGRREAEGSGGEGSEGGGGEEDEERRVERQAEAAAMAAKGIGLVDPEHMRRCFVAKTFSPSDLGLGVSADGASTPEAVTKASLMKAQRRRRTINKGITEIDGRKQSVDEVLGLSDALLGSVPPERLFSITGMFHPEAPIKVSWDIWLSMVIIWSVLEVTYRLGFDRPPEGGWQVLSYFVDALFFADMLVTLRTALLDRDGEVVANQKQVAVAYLKGWFTVDLISTVPWDLLVLQIAVGNANAATSTRLVRMLRLVRLMRLIRLLKIPDFMEEWEENSPLGPSSVKLGRLLVIMAFSAHVNACIWYAAGLHTAAEHNWIADYYCSDDGVSADCPSSKRAFSLYLTSIYFAFTTMTTTGYGDILPNRLSVMELVVAIGSEVLGATIFAWVIGNLVNLVLNLDPAERNRKSMMNYLTEYMREVPLSTKAKQAVARNYAFHLQVTGFVRVVLPLLKPATFAVGEVIVTPKIGTREMGFIICGEVEVKNRLKLAAATAACDSILRTVFSRRPSSQRLLRIMTSSNGLSDWLKSRSRR
ncbi:conserved unknown protein [Ectocarpus siliculosus]|uniref:Cyclic nucleotide-binding domain-containing protein n=1 Tax=Ectocarpus siliculosus TaxID=2880 RepID=D8LFK4_ECTSI|nr:conserved unknown protein [Ectocarpus siliculosus]|eukprot:CBN79924.1 conserved unknown protein [Ectocarpus siliculosus]